MGRRTHSVPEYLERRRSVKRATSAAGSVQRTAGQQTAGQQTAGQRTAGQRTAGQRTAGQQRQQRTEQQRQLQRHRQQAEEEQQEQANRQEQDTVCVVGRWRQGCFRCRRAGITIFHLVNLIGYHHVWDSFINTLLISNIIIQDFNHLRPSQPFIQ